MSPLTLMSHLLICIYSKNKFFYLTDLKILAACRNSITLMDINGTNVEVIAPVNLHEVRNIAVHKIKNYIYWTDWNGAVTTH